VGDPPDDAPRREIVLPRAFYIALWLGLAGAALYLLRSVLTPLLLAFGIAYVLDPVVDRLESLKVPRALAVALILVGGLGVCTLVVALVVPLVVKDIVGVASELPRKITQVLDSSERWFNSQGIEVPRTTAEWAERLGAHASDLGTSVLASASGILGAILGGGLAMVGSVVAALVVPVLAVYFLNDFDRIVAGMRSLIPRRYRRTTLEYAREIDTTLGHFIRGQLLVMTILAVLFSASYAALGVRLALPIGIASGILSFIPYLGGAFALLSGLLMSLLGGFNPGQLIGVVVAYTLVQMLEGFVISPRVMGKSVGLPEMWVLIALFTGGEIFGFLGILLAVPAAAVAKIFVSRAVAMYQESELYLEGPPSIIPSSPAPPSGEGIPPKPS